MNGVLAGSGAPGLEERGSWVHLRCCHVNQGTEEDPPSAMWGHYVIGCGRMNCFCVELGMEPRAWCKLSTNFTTELHSQPPEDFL